MANEQQDTVEDGEAENELSLTSLDYPSGFYHEQAPVHLNYICALNGVAAPDLTKPFDYCEVGCGTGLTTTILAAANPAGSFVGLDLSESHIASAQELAANGGVSNVSFRAVDISQVDPSEFPAFDYITFHGLYSWVPLEVRAALLQFIKATLKPGGLIYISYNALPGYGSVSPLRRFFTDMAPQLDGPLHERAAQITERLREMERKGAPFFVENPLAKKVLSHLLDYGSSYVAHEYLAAHWEALYFKDVAEALRTADLSFVGSAKPLENDPAYSLVPGFTETVAEIGDRLDREAISDFINNRFFRVDVFRRDDDGPSSYPAPVAPERVPFAMNVAPVEFPKEATLIYEKVTLSGPIFDRIKALFADQNLTLDEVLADSELAAQPRAEVERTFKLMTGDGFLGPAVHPTPELPDEPASGIKVVPPLNQTLLETVDWARQGLVLASPVGGNGVVINRFEAMLLLGLQQEDPVTWIFDELVRRDIHIKPTQSDTALSDPEEERNAIRVVIQQFLGVKLPKLAALGIVAPA